MEGEMEWNGNGGGRRRKADDTKEQEQVSEKRERGDGGEVLGGKEGNGHKADK